MNDVSVAVPRQIGRYTILRELRRERATVTYLGRDPVMHREVVLKTVEWPPPDDIGDHHEAQIAPMEQAFVRQAQAAGKLHHPHIVTVFEAGRVHHTGYMAIERVTGRLLHELIARGWRPDFVHCASMVARVADAIEYAHGQGVAHGHLGPQHIVLQADGAPKIEGFGGWIDGGVSGEDALHRTERLLPYFQNELSEEAQYRDVIAIAALLYMTLTGHAPSEPAAPVRSLRPDTPQPLARLIDTVLNPAAGIAHRTAGDLRDALTAYIWNARRPDIAPSSIGIPLAAPPADLFESVEERKAESPKTVGPWPAAPATTPGIATTRTAAPSGAAPGTAQPTTAAPLMAAPRTAPPNTAPTNPAAPQTGPSLFQDALTPLSAAISPEGASAARPATTPRITPTISTTAPIRSPATAPGLSTAPARSGSGTLPRQAPSTSPRASLNPAAVATARIEPNDGRAAPANAAQAAMPPASASNEPLIPGWQLALSLLRKNRILVAIVIGVVLVGLVIGIMLGSFAGSGGRISPVPSATRPAAAPIAAPSGDGLVKFDIAPWGEILVDNKPLGVSPPLTELKLAAGRHTIEIRYAGKAAVSAQVDVDSAQPQLIHHRFE